MDNYIKDIIEAGKVYSMNDYRTIITDRMGPWSNQDLRLAWEGDSKGTHICISPDEAEILFEKGLLKNVQRDYKDKLYIESVYCDIREFDGAIICGLLSPRTKLRNGILEYAKRMGYVLDHAVPVEMFNGTKSLTCNENGTYKITYKWSDEILEKFNMETVKNFTRDFWKIELNDTMYRFSEQKFYRSPILNISDKEFCVDNLREKEVFDRENIDAFREYDMQIRLMSPTIDRINLLKALVYLGFVCDSCPENLYSQYENSIKSKKMFLNLPITSYAPVLSRDCKSVKLHSGTVIYTVPSSYGNEYYYYKIDVPYSEGIRCLMKNFETLMNVKYNREFFYISFEPHSERIGFVVLSKAVGNFGEQLEDEFAILDYAITMYQNIENLNYHQMLRAVLEFLSSEIHVPYRETFDYYYNWLYRNLKRDK